MGHSPASIGRNQPVFNLACADNLPSSVSPGFSPPPPVGGAPWTFNCFPTRKNARAALKNAINGAQVFQNMLAELKEMKQRLSTLDSLTRRRGPKRSLRFSAVQRVPRIQMGECRVHERQE